MVNIYKVVECLLNIKLLHSNGTGRCFHRAPFSGQSIVVYHRCFCSNSFEMLQVVVFVMLQEVITYRDNTGVRV